MQLSEDQAQEITLHERRAERARGEIEVIVAEIQERTTPQALAGKAGHAVKEATVGRVGRAVDGMTDKVADSGGSVIDRIRQNPVPALLVGSGIAWLFMGGNRTAVSTPRYRTPAYPQKSHEVAAQVSERVGGVVDQASSTVGGAVEQASSSLGEAAETARQQVDEISTQAQERVQRLQSGFQQMLQENPLPLALVAAGLGAVIAAAVPKTNVEDQLAGPARERVAEQARQVGEKVGRVAERAQTSVKEAAAKEDLV
jgi:ElaB/YqjD/DUF883 family membrane-anchored ribosome-binding protein